MCTFEAVIFMSRGRSVFLKLRQQTSEKRVSMDTIFPVQRQSVTARHWHKLLFRLMFSTPSSFSHFLLPSCSCILLFSLLWQRCELCLLGSFSGKCRQIGLQKRGCLIWTRGIKWICQTDGWHRANRRHISPLPGDLTAYRRGRIPSCEDHTLAQRAKPYNTLRHKYRTSLVSLQYIAL